MGWFIGMRTVKRNRGQSPSEERRHRSTIIEDWSFSACAGLSPPKPTFVGRDNIRANQLCNRGRQLAGSMGLPSISAFAANHENVLERGLNTDLIGTGALGVSKFAIGALNAASPRLLWRTPETMIATPIRTIMGRGDVGGGRGPSIDQGRTLRNMPHAERRGDADGDLDRGAGGDAAVVRENGTEKETTRFPQGGRSDNFFTRRFYRRRGG